MEVESKTKPQKKKYKQAKYWLYDSLLKDFTMDLTTRDIADKLEITVNHVHSLVKGNFLYKNRWQVFDGSVGTPSKFLTHFILPKTLAIEAKAAASSDRAEEIYKAYYEKYRSGRQIIQLDKNGKIVRSFQTWNECSEKLGIKRTTVQSIVCNAKNLKRSIPEICFREDYEEVYEKYYGSS